jgi:hypothetical protein
MNYQKKLSSDTEIVYFVFDGPINLSTNQSPTTTVGEVESEICISVSHILNYHHYLLKFQ